MQPNANGEPPRQWPGQPGYPQPSGQYPGGYGRPPATGPYGPPAEPPRNRRHVNALLLPLILTLVALLSVSGFAAWAFIERGTYKNKTDVIVAKEVELAKQQTASEKDKEFIEKQKQPFKEYTGLPQFGSLHFSYPKTWSAFITENGKASIPIEGYMHPNYVPGLQSGTAFALRFQVVEQSYDAEMKKIEPKVKSGKLKVTPYRAKNVPEVLGSYVKGEINKDQNNAMVLLPLRDKTIKVWTESDEFLGDFENNVLPSLIFVP